VDVALSLEDGLTTVRRSPSDAGVVELIVRRPSEGEREVLGVAELDLEQGLVGDRWHASAGANGKPLDTSAQLTLMSVRALEQIEPDRSRWPLAGDQLYVDLDLAEEGLPAGTRLQIGTAVIEVSDAPHTGCGKFTARFGSDATRLVNSKDGRRLRLRGMNARVIEPGLVRTGDTIRKLR
jgi:MOSC domain-containing protein YiiM